MKKVFSNLCQFEKSIDTWFVLAFLFIFSLLRIPSLIEPDWYGDEGVYQVLGMAVNKGRLLYSQIWDNKPPILYLIYSIFNGDLFSVRVLSLLFGILSVLCFYFLAKRLLDLRIKIYLSTLIFAVFFGLPLIEGNIANAENFMLLPTIIAGILILDALRLKKRKNYIIAGALISFAFLIKIVAVFDFAAFLIFMLAVGFGKYLSFSEFKKNYKNILNPKLLLKKLNNEIIFTVSFFVPIILTLLFFSMRGAIGDFTRATFSQNVGYVGYGNYFLFPMGMMTLKIIVLFAILAFLLKIRKSLGNSGLFLYIWLVFSVFNALFSERPYPHYLLVGLPSIALFTSFLKKGGKLIFLNLVLFIFIFFIAINNFNLDKRIGKYSLFYYENYINFVLGKNSITSYQEFFDKNTTRDYTLANFIAANTKSDDSVFLWSDSPQIYALSGKLPPGRYTVSYHITFYKNAMDETRNAINTVKPKYIIVTKHTPEVNNFLIFYNLKYIIKGSKVYEREI